MFGLSSTVLKLALYAVAALSVAAAVGGFMLHERHIGEAKIVAQYTAAAKAEAERQAAVLADTQHKIQTLTSQLDEAQNARNALLQQNAALARARNAAACLDADSVRAVDRVH